jgi:hypothetical protein
MLYNLALANISFTIYFHFVDLTCSPNILLKDDMDDSTLLYIQIKIMVKE